MCGLTAQEQLDVAGMKSQQELHHLYRLGGTTELKARRKGEEEKAMSPTGLRTLALPRTP